MRSLVSILMLIGFLSGGKLLAEKRPHWAFIPPSLPEIPDVDDLQWAQQPIDRFILEALETHDLRPSEPADPATLLRRVWLDVLGIPPSPQDVDRFVTNLDPRAYEGIVDELLASYHYGERWGRHWLDVARYGDSNGGDENHAYPHSFRYRNWVIQALNRDMPFNVFLRQQLAGDKLADPLAVAGTGFLAIGTKILAEQDPVKKQADIVNEQIDTIGRAFMGVSIGCARCHDHKFDPISQDDYYAMAGIFHSTKITETELKTKTMLVREREWQLRIDSTNLLRGQANLRLLAATDDLRSLDWEAEDFTRGNVVVDRESYGSGIGIISDPGGQDNFAEYEFEIPSRGHFLLQLRYAAKTARPGRILVDQEVAFPEALTAVTGGWMPENQQWHLEGELVLTAGRHLIRIESKPLMAHIDRVRLVAVRDMTQTREALADLRALDELLAKLDADRPQHDQVMSVAEGEIRSVPVNLRGNPHAEGEIIPRGALTGIGSNAELFIREDSSGRLELADWMGADNHPLTARVIVNRIWQWYFGRGLVETPDNFGSTGQAPSHPELLDWLVVDFIQADWSLKHLHRRILLSSVYRQSSVDPNPVAEERDPTNRWYWRRDVRRMDAESFRDSLLRVAGILDFNEFFGSPIGVTYQDPSPDALAKNRKAYESFPHRTVYLPVVRSHLYDLLTLLDFPNSTMPTGKRSLTTVPTQALMMLNSSFISERSRDLCRQVLGEFTGERDRLEQLFKILYSRSPSEEEVNSCRSLLQHSLLGGQGEQAWMLLTHTLVIANEFLHVW